MAEIVMPRLSDSMEEGTILKWLKADGDAVSRGEPLAEIETDKATLTYESDAAGVLTIVVSAGETLPIGAVIARLDGGEGASPAGPATATQPSPPAEPPPATATAPPAPAPDPGTRAQSPTLPLPPPVQAATATAKGDITVLELTRVQQVIARRMSESKATVPEFTLRSEIDMEACVALRAE